jgi:hypothetical protein
MTKNQIVFMRYFKNKNSFLKIKNILDQIISINLNFCKYIETQKIIIYFLYRAVKISTLTIFKKNLIFFEIKLHSS